MAARRGGGGRTDQVPIESIVDELLLDPPADPVELKDRVRGTSPGPLRKELVRRLLEPGSVPREQTLLLMWLVELKPKNSTIRLLDALSDRSLLMETRSLAFILLVQVAERELHKRMATLTPLEKIGIPAAADTWLKASLGAIPDEVVKPQPRRVKPRRATAIPRVCRMKITLRGIRPPIWRRLEVRDDITLGRLNSILQDAMGWTDTHLHLFLVGDERIGTPDDEWNDTVSEKKVRLRDLTGEGVKRFVYEYDFGDGWEHDIVIEKIGAPEDGVRYPRCVTGKRACPPEDCGGIWGYKELLETIADSEHPEHKEMLEWTGPFDPESFDIEWVNQKLQRKR